MANTSDVELTHNQILILRTIADMTINHKDCKSSNIAWTLSLEVEEVDAAIEVLKQHNFIESTRTLN